VTSQTPDISAAQTLSPKTKDPKKVEAGRKGAAARKAKQEAILRQLREAKEAIHETANTSTSDKPAKQDNYDQPPLVAAATVSQSETSREADNGESSPWAMYLAIGGAAVGALWLATKRQGTSSAGNRAERTLHKKSHYPLPSNAPIHAANMNQPSSLHVLDTRPDPFHMQ